jgi:phenylacetate-CoA ligase
MSSLAHVVYAHSPLALQNILVSVQGWVYRYRRCNQALPKAHADLMNSQFWSEDQFTAFQTSQLVELLRHAFTSVPFYIDLRRQLQCDPEDFRTIQNLRRLPILEKHQIRGAESRFLSNKYGHKLCNRFHTSGTTGTPLLISEPSPSFARRWAFVTRLRTWAGLTNPFYPRRAQFTGRDIACGGTNGVYWRRNYPGNALLLSTTHISRQSAGAYAKALCEFRPELLDGYPSAMRILARMAATDGHELPKVKAIIVSAETLAPEARTEIEGAFGCRVYNQYAATEPSCFWCDCKEGAMHQNPEYGISEIVDEDGNAVSPGESGDVVVTSFLNPAMPLIRYRLGDVAVLDTKTTCSCGRAMPRVELVLGRCDDVLIIPGRGSVGRMDPVFKGLTNIIESQIIQESFERIRVLVVPAEGYSFAVEQKLRANITRKVGSDIRVDIIKVGAIPRGANGKFRSVVSEVRHSIK